MAIKGIRNKTAGCWDLKNRIIFVKSRQILIAFHRACYLYLSDKIDYL